MHIDTSIILKQKCSIIHSKIIQKHLILLGYEFPKTKLAFALYGFSMQTIYFVKDLPKPHHGRGMYTAKQEKTYNYHVFRHNSSLKI